MQVEVSVQDYFFTDNAIADPEAIAEETWHSWFQQWLEALQPQIADIENCELSLRLTNDAEMQALNAQYRQKNQPTDVLAFAALEVDYAQPDELRSLQPLYLGDIAISVDTARRQALERGHTLQVELAWLASHGLLHLLGWDHPDEASLEQMLQQQATLLHSIGLQI